MKKIYILVIGFLTFHSSTAQAPPALNTYYAIDYDNDGLASFDIDWLTHNYVPELALHYNNFDLSGYEINMYAGPSWEIVAGSDFINAIPYSQTLLEFNYLGVGPEYEQIFLVNSYSGWFLQPLNALDDPDNDGISNLQEDANSNGNLMDDDDDGDWNPNYMDSDNTLSVIKLKSNSFSISPNPASGIIALKINALNIKNYDVKISDISGKNVFTVTNTEEKLFDISKLVHGVYFIEVSSDNFHSVKKLVVM